MSAFPSEFDSQKWAVRPAGASPTSIPYFYVNANQDHVEDPLAHLGFAEGFAGRSLNLKTKMRPGYEPGPGSRSSHAVVNVEAISTGSRSSHAVVDVEAISASTRMEDFAPSVSSQILTGLEAISTPEAVLADSSLSEIAAVVLARQTVPTTTPRYNPYPLPSEYGSSDDGGRRSPAWWDDEVEEQDDPIVQNEQAQR